MRLINHTPYTTNSLKKLFTRCLNEMEKVEGKVKRLQKQLTKWRQKKNYYEKTLKASGKI